MSEPRRRYSAALILGLLSGALAAITVLATSIPITRRLAETEEALSRRHAVMAVEVAQGIVDDGRSLDGEIRESLQLGHLAHTASDGRVVYVSGTEFDAGVIAAACEQTSYTIVDRSGRGWAIACRDTDQGRVTAAWSPNFASQSEIYWLVLTLSALVGIVTAMGVLAFLRPLTNMSSALDRVRAGERGVRVEHTGLTELDELVDHLNLAAQAMEDREDAIVARIKVVQQLARLVAHEVRNPLQSLELLTSLIADEENPAERAELAASLHAEISTLNAVVQRLLSKDATSGALRLSIVTAPLRATIEHIVSMRGPEALSHGTRIELGDVSPLAVPFDPALLGRSIENLVINAMQTVPEGYGLIRITVEEEPDAIAIRVGDNGPGVDPEYGAQIFEADVTTKERGTGLGLTLVRGVVEAHGGYIEYDDSPLGGARFTMRIPKVERESDGELA